MRSVVVTGASTGIGCASAKLLLDKGFRGGEPGILRARGDDDAVTMCHALPLVPAHEDEVEVGPELGGGVQLHPRVEPDPADGGRVWTFEATRD